jgi:septum formation protein
MTQIILASSSPRRAALLTQIGLLFEIISPGVDESQVSFSEDPAGATEQLALCKAQAVASQHETPGRLVIGADTIVVLDHQIFGKPDDAAEARAMLQALNGRAHIVITGFALVATGTDRFITTHEKTTVHMRALTDEEIEAYLATGEPFDKAGAYGAQGYGGSLIARIEGCFYNVVGLPLSRLVTTLKAFG